MVHFVTDEDWRGLANAVQARRKALRLPLDLVDRGGPSEMTMRKIERGESTTVRPKTKVQLEHALGWPDGIVDRILAGNATEEELSAIVLTSPRVTADFCIHRGIAEQRLGRSAVDDAPATDAITIRSALTDIALGSTEAIDTVSREAITGFRDGTVSVDSALAVVAVLNALPALFRAPSTPTIRKARTAMLGVLEAELLPNSGLRYDYDVDGLLGRVRSLSDVDKRRLLAMLSQDVETGI